ncbi:GGDEF domain-containing protein [Thalassomonas viridans]|uniref:GGDEF domain-containing protein n=1 Tax=Thalassomonas viridans TaxID=137584 RepID=A0AAF0CAH0_9GAMM|nr:GGDEF domain-containing protein [Thalassomonas viridans]WDE06511.1 GGDEF domain-containing protein [Thalassomonas viridans]
MINAGSHLPIPEKDYLTIEQRKIADWYRTAFQQSNISLWLIDLGLLPGKLEEYASRDIRDYHRYFARHLFELLALARQVKVVDINSPTLALYGGNDKANFLEQVSHKHNKDQLEVLKKLVVALLEQRHYFETEATACHEDGHRFKVVMKAIIPETVTDHTRMIISVTSLAQRKKVPQLLFPEQEIYQTFLNNAPVCIHEIDHDGRLTAMNNCGLQMLRLNDVGQILGCRYLSLVADEDKPRIEYLMLRAFKGYSSEFEFQLRCNGELRVFSSCFIPIEENEHKVHRIIGITQDITERKHSEEEMYHQANYDLLTNLPNRSHFTDSVKQALIQARRRRHGLALLFIDLDNFKPINDTYGHAMGDTLLQQVSATIKNSLRKEDLTCRFGGDEFIILLPSIAKRNNAAVVAEKVLRCIQKPINLANHQLSISASIGISTFPEDGDSYETLMPHADMAMYKVKNFGGNNYQFHQIEKTSYKM